MAWVESSSPLFHCRHSSASAEDAAGVLGLLERTRERLERHFPRTAEVTVVLHDSPTSLALSNPLLPVIWTLAEPSSRRGMTGWVGARELHVLSPQALRERSTGVSGSHEMLALTPASLYVRRVLLECNHDVQHSRLPGRGTFALRWAWLLEGVSRWFSGESGYSRSVIGHRMRHGSRPQFPPSFRDAPLLAAPLVDQLAKAHGEAAVAQLAARLHPHGARGALSKAFSGRSLASVENDWRGELRRLADGG